MYQVSHAVNFVQDDQPVFLSRQKGGRVAQLVALFNRFQVKVKGVLLLANFERKGGFAHLARPDQRDRGLARQGLQYGFLSFSD